MNKNDPLEYLWNYFERHSAQRMQMFNYYILVNIAILTGIGICLKESAHFLVLPSILLLFLNDTFRKIDERTVSLIKEVEKSIKCYERENFDSSYQIFLNEEATIPNPHNSVKSYSRIFNNVYNITDFIAIFFIAVGLWNIFS